MHLREKGQRAGLVLGNSFRARWNGRHWLPPGAGSLHPQVPHPLPSLGYSSHTTDSSAHRSVSAEESRGWSCSPPLPPPQWQENLVKDLFTDEGKLIRFPTNQLIWPMEVLVPLAVWRQDFSCKTVEHNHLNSISAVPKGSTKVKVLTLGPMLLGRGSFWLWDWRLILGLLLTKRHSCCWVLPGPPPCLKCWHPLCTIIGVKMCTKTETTPFPHIHNRG